MPQQLFQPKNDIILSSRLEIPSAHFKFDKDYQALIGICKLKKKVRVKSKIEMKEFKSYERIQKNNTDICYFPRHIFFKHFNGYSLAKTLHANVTDQRSIGKPYNINSIFRGKLREYQISIMNEVKRGLLDDTKGNMGILNVYCGCGKTFMALYMSYVLKRCTLVVVHKRDFIEQWKDSIENLIAYARVHVASSSSTIEDFLKSDVIIITYQLLCAGTFTKEQLSCVGFVIYDECHHLAADTFAKCTHYTLAKYVLGLSATTNRKDNMHHYMHQMIGPILSKRERPYKEVFIDTWDFEDGVQKVVWDRSTQFKEIDFLATRQKLFEDPQRNDLITDIFEKRILEGHCILALSVEIKHINDLMQQISDKLIRHYPIVHCASGKICKYKIKKRKRDNFKEINITLPKIKIKTKVNQVNDAGQQETVVIEDKIELSSIVIKHDHFWKYVCNENFGFHINSDFNLMDRYLFDFTYLRRHFSKEVTVKLLKLKYDKIFIRIGQKVGGRTNIQRQIQKEKESWFGSYQNCSEGLDIVELTNIIMCSPPEGFLDQIIGRTLRKENVLTPTIDDIRDTFQPFMNQYRGRVSHYNSKRYIMRTGEL